VNGLRFAPPEWRWTSEQLWILSRAFGPVGHEVAPPSDPERAAREAQALGLAERIGARSGDERLATELGDVAAARLIQASSRARSKSTALLEAAREVADCAGAAGMSVVPLKGAALHLGRYVPPGARPAGDVDILVPPDQASVLCARLVAGGWEKRSVASGDHELSPLVDAKGRVVELHRYIPGVRVPSGGRRFARLGPLEAEGLLERGAGGVLLPSRQLLLAHVTAHAIAQHGLVPRSYPLTRGLADLCDLGAADGDDERAWRLVARDVSPAELAAVKSLCRLLGEGDLTFLTARRSDSRVLLTHAIAGAFDDAYRDALVLRALFHRPAEDSRLLAMARSGWRAVRFPRHGATVARRVVRALARRRPAPPR
jgi:hypothetical protein